jgi:hypothetical protein
VLRVEASCAFLRFAFPLYRLFDIVIIEGTKVLNEEWNKVPDNLLPPKTI